MLGALVLGVYAGGAQAQPVRWEAPGCPYSIEFPGEPTVEVVSAPGDPAIPDPSTPRLTNATFVHPSGTFLVGCARSDNLLAQDAVRYTALSHAANGRLIGLTEAPCTEIGGTTPLCATVEFQLVHEGQEIARAISIVRADGFYIFWVVVFALGLPPDSPLTEVEQAFVGSVARKTVP